MIDGYDTAGVVVWLMTGLGGAAAILLWGFVRSMDGRVERWAASRSVPLTAATRPYVTRRLRSSRRWRTAAVALAWSTPFAWVGLHRSAYESLDGRVTASVFLGSYLAAVLVAEVLAARRQPPGGGAALDTRRVEQYVPRLLFSWSARVAITTAALAVVAALLVEPEVGRPYDASRQIAMAVASIGAVLAAQWTSAFIVARRQPVVSPALLLADDALRSWSAHSCVGALLTAQLLVLSQQAVDVVSVVDGPVRWFLGAVATAALLAAVGTFQVVAGPEWHWRVRRDIALGGGPAA